MNTVEYRSNILGMSYNKAGRALRKALLFNFAQLTGMQNCFRCGKKIESVTEFTIDHKVDWQNSAKPKELFLDINNIAFSHHRCNSAAGNGGQVTKARAKPYAPVVTVPCKNCGEPVKRLESYMKRRSSIKGIYCTPSCARKGYWKAQRENSLPKSL